jgi:uncharacterized damage-inducible protein DinB
MVTPVHQLQSSLRESRGRLFTAIRGLTEEEFRFTPSAESWPIAAHLAHLLRSERIYTERARVALAEDEPLVASTRTSNDHDPGLAQRLAIPQIIHGMLNTRRDLDAVLNACDDRALQARAIRHETLGRMTLEQIMMKMAGHEAEHAADVAALVKQLPPSARVRAGVSGGEPGAVTIPLVPRS